MFWPSIVSGFMLLRHWQVWLAIALYASAAFAFMSAVFAVGSRKEALGCLFQTFGWTVLHGILMVILVAFLMPIILGGSSATSISVIIGWLLPLAKIGVIAMVAVTLMCFVPLLGGFIASSHGIQAFLEGVIIFTALSRSTIEQILRDSHVQGTVYPGFWECLGFLVIAGIFVKLIEFAIVTYLTFADVAESAGDLILMAVAPALGVSGGIIPLFMYGSYIRLSLEHLIRGT